MSRRKLTPAEDIAAFKKETKKPHGAKPPLTDRERKDELLPKPLVKVVNYATGDVTQASLEQLNQQMRDFRKVILVIEDEAHDSTTCATALHELGYNGVQLITHLQSAEQHLDDIISGLTAPPAAIVLDLGLGYDSGYAVLRTCHAEPRLQKVPIPSLDKAYRRSDESVQRISRS